ncbi:MAG: hypothetical protein Q8Q36_02815 [bacterium]|nr:hypothetical protein [bacterium]
MKILKPRETAKERAKPVEIIRESQKIFTTLSKAGYVLLVIFLVIGLILSANEMYEKYKQRKIAEEEAGTALAAPAPRPRHTAPAPATKQVTERRIIAYPDRWSEPVVTPPNHSGRIAPEGKVRIRDLRGNEWDDEPGMANFREEDVANFAFRFKSRTAEPVGVVVYHQPR